MSDLFEILESKIMGHNLKIVFRKGWMNGFWELQAGLPKLNL